MTEFEKWWKSFEKKYGLLPGKGYCYIAEKAWQAAQRTLIRTIEDPPYVPSPGEKI